jgi:hypothetical protein
VCPAAAHAAPNPATAASPIPTKRSNEDEERMMTISVLSVQETQGSKLTIEQALYE